jgi:hypothetical protein
MSSCSFTPQGPVAADKDWCDALACVCRIEGEGAASRQAQPFANDNDGREQLVLVRLPNRSGSRLACILSRFWKGEPSQGRIAFQRLDREGRGLA